MDASGMRVGLAVFVGVVCTTFALLPAPPDLSAAAADESVKVPPRRAEPIAPPPVDARHVFLAAPAQAPVAIPGNSYFRVDRNGRLVLDADTGTKLERLLDEAAERGPDDDAGAVAAQGLPAAQAAQARAVVGAYALYLSSRAIVLGELRMDDDFSAARRRNDEIHALRVRLFGERDAAGLFGADEQRMQQFLDELERQTHSKETT